MLCPDRAGQQHRAALPRGGRRDRGHHRHDGVRCHAPGAACAKDQRVGPKDPDRTCQEVLCGSLVSWEV